MAKHPGSDRKIFGTVDFKLYCDECKKRRLTSCAHRRDLQPAWKGVTKFEIAEILYGDDYKAYHMRETMGATANDDNRLFDESWINLLERRPLWERKTRDCRPSHIYLSVDPNAGGTSRMAIISMAYVQGVYLVRISFFIFFNYQPYNRTRICFVCVYSYTNEFRANL